MNNSNDGMSYQEKENVISLITLFVVSIPYCIYVIVNYPSGNADTFKYLATAILLSIPVRIVCEIIFRIILAIFKEAITKQKENSLIDERDKIIELKGTRNAFYIFCIGMLISMTTVAIGRSPNELLITLIIFGFFSEIFGIISKIYYYKRGF